MKLMEYYKNPRKILESAVHSAFPGHLLSDKTAISILYKARFGRNIDFNNPRSFNEKILWLTIYDRKPAYSVMVDKYMAKNYISKVVGEGFVPLNIRKWKKTQDIKFEELPSKYVLKCNHDSGSVVVCNNRQPTNDELRKLDHAVKKNYYWFSREWPYKNVEPCIFCEEYIESPLAVDGGLVDYKIYCFDGNPYMVCVISNRTIQPYLTFLDPNWNKLVVKQRYPNHPSIPCKPKELNRMMSMAEQLSSGIPFLRVDFFEDKNKRLYVGEMTFTPSSGLIRFEPDEFDYELGEKLVLPKR